MSNGAALDYRKALSHVFKEGLSIITQDINANKSFAPKSDMYFSQIQTINWWPHDPQLCRHTPFWSLLPYPSYLIRHSPHPDHPVSLSLFLCEHRAFFFFDMASLSFPIHYSSKVMNTDPSSFFSVLGAFNTVIFLSFYYTQYYTILQCILLISTFELK